ncbi:MAG: DNA polymerase IV [Micropruina sp.]|nr:DNA polymerase IV [Micropruina sp.]
MRSVASILHVDLDAFFAAAEQRDKPSLRGKPVIVGGVGQRGVVSTASYEARRFGVHSAMPMHEARRKCPHAAVLTGRFDVYRRDSTVVMGLLRELSPLVEPLSLDEAFVDLAGGGFTAFESDALTALAEDLRARLRVATGGLTASVGMGSSKFIAKVASELAKPDGIRVIEPGTEVAVIAPLSARAIPGVGPVTMEKLARLGVKTVADLQQLSLKELVRELGRAGGEGLHELAFARDDRPVEPERETKSISVEDTFEHDITDVGELLRMIERDAASLAARVAAPGLFARTISLKVRYPDFTTLTRSRTLEGATDRAEVIARVAKGLFEGLELGAGIRLLGVGVSGFTQAAQEALFDPDQALGPVSSERFASPTTDSAAETAEGREVTRWRPGEDVSHATHGAGWVWGAGLGKVTVRFETAQTGPGPVRTFPADDPELSRRPVSDEEAAGL